MKNKLNVVCSAYAVFYNPQSLFYFNTARAVRNKAI